MKKFQGGDAKNPGKYKVICSCNSCTFIGDENTTYVRKLNGRTILVLLKVIPTLISETKKGQLLIQCKCGKTIASSSGVGFLIDLNGATKIKQGGRTLRTSEFLRRFSSSRASNRGRNLTRGFSSRGSSNRGRNLTRGSSNRGRNSTMRGPVRGNYQRRNHHHLIRGSGIKSFNNYSSNTRRSGGRIRHDGNQRGRNNEIQRPNLEILFSKQRFIEKDLRRLTRIIKEEKEIDSLEILSKRTSFTQKVLNSENVHGMKEECVTEVLCICEISISKSISGPSVFIESLLLPSKFCRIGLSLFIRSKTYFTSMYSVERLCEFLKTCLRYSPKKSVKILPLGEFKNVIHPRHCNNELVKEVIERKLKIESLGAEEEEEDEGEIEEEEEEEIDSSIASWDYEYASILPTRSDFEIRKDSKPDKLPPRNLSLWNSEKEYLSTHFKLIREDFIGKFKEGFRKWMDFCSNVSDDFDFRDMNVFTEARLKHYRISKFGEYEVEVAFKLPSETMKNKLRKRKFSSYVANKALMRRSLVVLFRTDRGGGFASREEEEGGEGSTGSRISFDPIVCTVIDNGKIMTRRVTVQPYSSSQFKKLSFERDSAYLMLESPEFFTAYESVLKSLQEKERVPFPDVVLKGDDMKNLPPEYIKKNPKLDISVVCDDKKLKELGTKSFIVDNCCESWPSHEETILNESENDCMRECFRRRFSLIQGGPGTGKTFIGRKIVQVMKKNFTRSKRLGCCNVPLPIVVICYTNHALDAFLEPMIGDFPKMVRIGTRSRSENPRYLKRNLNELMRPRNRRMSGLFSQRSFTINQSLREVSDQVRRLQREIRNLSFIRFQVTTWESLFRERLRQFDKLRRLIVEEFLKHFKGEEWKFFPTDDVEKYILEDIWMEGEKIEDAVMRTKNVVLKNLNLKKSQLKRRKKREKNKKVKERRRKEEEEMLLKKKKEEEEEERKRRRKKFLEESRKKIEEEKMKKKKKEEEEKKKKMKEKEDMKSKKNQDVKSEKLGSVEEEKKEKITPQQKIISKNEKNRNVLDWSEDDDKFEIRPSEVQRRNEEFNTHRRQLDAIFGKSRVVLEAKKESDLNDQNSYEDDSEEEEEEEEEGEGEVEDVEEEIVGEIEEEEEEEQEVEVEEEKEEQDQVVSQDSGVLHQEGGEVKEEEQEGKMEFFRYNNDMNELTKKEEDVEEEEVVLVERVESSVPTMEEEDDDEEEESEELKALQYLEAELVAEVDPNSIMEEKERERNDEESERDEVVKFLSLIDEEELLDDDDDEVNDNDLLLPNSSYQSILKGFVESQLEGLPKPWAISGKQGRAKVMKAIFNRFLQKLRIVETRSFKKFKELFEKKQSLKLEMELELLKGADIIGLTSTMASIRRRLLNRLNAKIFIIEEAAELLEGQIAACLPEELQHLVLIGDHKQLKPKVKIMKLKQCDIDVSMFERMDDVGITMRSLLIQHRMRPEISFFMKYFYYPKMEDHESVSKFPPVVGHCHNIQFITHSEPESTTFGSRSKNNKFEANFVVNHALYILKHGRYKPNNITIITPYKGQLYVIKDFLRKAGHVSRRGGGEEKRIRVETVDDFQGEENEIILVSLVRSQTRYRNNNNNNNNVRRSDSSIGFLKIENRIIVLMSRSKHGIYLYGNSSHLENDSSDWKKILELLGKKVKDHLLVKCENHPENTMEIRYPDDFKKFVCNKECGFQYPTCHHICRKKCHMYKVHTKCRNTCGLKIPKCGHFCMRKCSVCTEVRRKKIREKEEEEEEGEDDENQEKEDVVIGCKCNLMIEHRFKCDHTTKIRCGTNKEDLVCQKFVTHTFPDCNHTSDRIKCYQRSETRCFKIVDQKLPCGHIVKKKCHEKFSEEDLQRLAGKCIENVNFSLSCGHVRTKRCNQKLSELSEEEMRCNANVSIKLTPCGHKKKKKCFEKLEELRRRCLKLCKKRLEKCDHKCSGVCWECTERGGHRMCQIVVDDECKRCGGSVRRNCSNSGTEYLCKNQCPTIMKCGHRCTNRCSSCNGDHKCMDVCRRVRICGHKCKGDHDCGTVQCPPCQERVVFRCSHGLLCGSVCSEEYRFCDQVRYCQHNVPYSQACRKCEKRCDYWRHLPGSRYGRINVRCRNRCPHRRCQKKCHSRCNVNPCSERCPKIFECGHRCQSFCGGPCARCMICDAMYSPEGTAWVCPISGLPFHPKYMSEDCVVVLECECVFWGKHLDREMFKIGYDVFLRCPKCRKRLSFFQCYRYQDKIKISFYAMENLNQIRRLVKNIKTIDGSSFSLGRHEKVRLERDLDGKIHKFVKPLVHDGIIRRYFERRGSDGNVVAMSFPEKIQKANKVMEDILEFEKMFFSETGMDISSTLSKFLKNLKTVSNVSSSILICENLNALIISKNCDNESFNASRMRRIWEVEVKIRKTLRYLKYVGDSLDEFYNCYVKLLVKRLLLGISNLEDEEWLYNLLRKEFAGMFEGKKWYKTKELADIPNMLKSIENSKQLCQKYHEGSNELQMDIIRKKDFFVKVLDQSVWKMMNPNNQDNFPLHPFFRSHSKMFEDYYKEKIHKLKNLRWMFSGTNSVKMIARFEKGEQKVIVNGIQASILDMFNTKNEYSWDEVEERFLDLFKGRKDHMKYFRKISTYGKRMVNARNKSTNFFLILQYRTSESTKEGTSIEKIFVNEVYSQKRKNRTNNVWKDLRSPSLSYLEFLDLCQKKDVDRLEQVKAACCRVMKKAHRMAKIQLIHKVISQEVKLFRADVLICEKAIRELRAMEILLMEECGEFGESDVLVYNA